MQTYRKSAIAESYEVIGVMSGTSVDGLDIACCRFTKNETGWNFEILHAVSINYNEDWRNRLLNIINASAADIFSLDIEFGNFIGNNVNQFINQYKLRPVLIASHGHTVFHQPSKHVSIQIGNGIAINNLTGITTINDFRKLDVILGGQGAPLVPIGDALLFPEYDFCLNLGGFSNVSYEKSKKRIAYDICPVNIVLNHLARKLNIQYDDRGNIAANGILNQEILNQLNELEFYRLPYPKSLGLEWVKEKILPMLENQERIPDLLSTFTHHIAFQINKALGGLNETRGKNKRVLITGGGAYNDFLIAKLHELNTSGLNYVVPDNLVIDFKEAMIFAFIGLLRYRGEINTYRSVTGASTDSCGGIIHDNFSKKKVDPKKE